MKERMQRVELTEVTPLLMHADNILWGDEIKAWETDPANTEKSTKGDDRTPPYKWVGYLNYDDPQTGVVTIPSEYIMRTLMGGAAMVPTGKKQKTFKSQSQSGILCRDFHWPLLVNGKPIYMKDIQKIRDLNTFKEQSDAVESLGFSLFMKRVPIGQNGKHVRVRPRFSGWSTCGDVTIIDEQITAEVFKNILTYAGRYKGLGDWRPGAPKSPGPFGMFTAKIS